ncbi:MAG: amidohydrolase family protein [Gemmatimonadota bacterium]
MTSHRIASALVLLSLGLNGPHIIPSPRPVAFVDITVLPMDQDRRLEHQTVIVENGLIASMGPAAEVRIPARVRQVSGRGKFLIPGLADMHVHVDDTTDFLLYLAKGVTTVRNLEGEPYHVQWREEINRGELIGPNIFTSGPFTNLPGIKTPDDARRAVMEQKAAGYDEIKIHGGLEAETYDTLAAVAHRLGIRLVGHAPRNLPFDNLLRNHQDEISHAEEVLYTYFKSDVSDTSVARIPLVARALQERDIWMTATFVTYDRIYRQVANLDSLLADPATAYVTPYQLALWQRENNRYIRNWGPSGVPKLQERRDFLFKLIRGLHQGGVRIMTGTDAIGPLWIPGWSLHEELRDFVAMGFTPYEALSAATRLPAQYLGQEQVFGTIAPGRRADLVLLDRDPMVDIGNTESIGGVMVRGRWFPRVDLEQKLSRLAQANRAEERLVQGILERGVVIAAHKRCMSSQPPLVADAQRLLDLRLTWAFARVVRDSGVAVAEGFANTVRSQCPEAVLFSEWKINTVGSAFRAQHRLNDAVQVLGFNVRLFPESFLSHYWLAEALLENGDTTQAVVSYQRSVELDPGMQEAIARLKELGQN